MSIWCYVVINKEFISSTFLHYTYYSVIHFVKFRDVYVVFHISYDSDALQLTIPWGALSHLLFSSSCYSTHLLSDTLLNPMMTLLPFLCRESMATFPSKLLEASSCVCSCRLSLSSSPREKSPFLFKPNPLNLTALFYRRRQVPLWHGFFLKYSILILCLVLCFHYLLFFYRRKVHYPMEKPSLTVWRFKF